MSDKETSSRRSWLETGNRKVIALATGTAIVVGGAFGVQAFADSKTFAHAQLIAGDRHEVAWQGGPHAGFSDLSEAEIQSRVERMVKHVAIEIDATPEQQEKIISLVTAVAADLQPMREQMRETGEAIQKLLLADTIDRAALERVRADGLAEAERISKSLVDAVADVAEVLTAEQRQQLDERIKDFRSMGKGWRRG